jgi:phage gp37-like protein
MDPINVTENFILNAVRTGLGAKLKTVQSLPGNWDADMLARLIVNSPAVYAAFLGGPVKPTDQPQIQARFGIYSVTTNPSGDAARRLGSGRAIGGYEILATIIPLLHGQIVPDVGSLLLTGAIDNLFTGTLAKQNLTIYEAQFSVPMTFDYTDPSALDPAGLDLFETFHVDYDLDGKVQASDDIHLPS